MSVDEGYTRYACDRAATMHDDGKKPEEYIKPGSSEESNWHLVKYMDFNQVVREYCLCDECYDKYKAMHQYFDKDFTQFINQGGN